MPGKDSAAPPRDSSRNAFPWFWKLTSSRAYSVYQDADKYAIHPDPGAGTVAKGPFLYTGKDAVVSFPRRSRGQFGSNTSSWSGYVLNDQHGILVNADKLHADSRSPVSQLGTACTAEDLASCFVHQSDHMAQTALRPLVDSNIDSVKIVNGSHALRLVGKSGYSLESREPAKSSCFAYTAALSASTHVIGVLSNIHCFDKPVPVTFVSVGLWSFSQWA